MIYLAFLTLVSSTLLSFIQCSTSAGLPKYMKRCLTKNAGSSAAYESAVNNFDVELARLYREKETVDAEMQKLMHDRLTVLANINELPSTDNMVYAIQIHVSFVMYDRKQGFVFDADTKRHDNELISEFLFAVHRTLHNIELLDEQGRYEANELNLIRERFHSIRVHFQYLACYCLSVPREQKELMAIYDGFSTKYFAIFSNLLQRNFVRESARFHVKDVDNQKSDAMLKITINEDTFMETIKTNAKPFTHLHFPIDASALLARVSALLEMPKFGSFVKSLFLGLYELDARLRADIDKAASLQEIGSIDLSYDGIKSVLSKRLDFEDDTINDYIQAFAQLYRLYALLKLCGVVSLSEFCFKQYEYPILDSTRDAVKEAVDSFHCCFTKLTGKESSYVRMIPLLATKHTINDHLPVPVKHSSFFKFCAEHGFTKVPPVLTALKNAVCFENLLPAMPMEDRARFLAYYTNLHLSLLNFVHVFSADEQNSKLALFEDIHNVGERSFEAQNGVFIILNRLQSVLPIESSDTPQHRLIADFCKLTLLFVDSIASIAQADHYFDNSDTMACGWSQNLVSSLTAAISSKTRTEIITESITRQKRLLVESKSVAKKWKLEDPSKPHDGLLTHRLEALWESVK